MNRKQYLILMIVFSIIVLVTIFILIPSGTKKYVSENSGKILEVPKFSWVKEECCMYSVSFESFRSKQSLKYDLDRIMKSYEQIKCDGHEYYYNEDQNITIIDFDVQSRKFTNSFFITYDKGNICKSKNKNDIEKSNNYSGGKEERDIIPKNTKEKTEGLNDSSVENYNNSNISQNTTNNASIQNIPEPNNVPSQSSPMIKQKINDWNISDYNTEKDCINVGMYFYEVEAYGWECEEVKWTDNSTTYQLNVHGNPDWRSRKNEIDHLLGII